MKKDGVWISGDQHPLSGGWLRAVYFQHLGYLIHYFRHDADGQSAWVKIEKKIRKKIFWWFNKYLVVFSGKSLPFTLFAKPMPFAPFVDPDQIRLSGAGKTTILQEMAKIADSYPRRLDIVSPNDAVLKADINNINSGILVAIAYFKYLVWMWKLAGTLPAIKRPGIYLRIPVIAIVLLVWLLIPGLSLSRLMWWMGQLVIGHPVPGRMKQTSLSMFIRSKAELVEFWKNGLSSTTEGGIPFFRVTGLPGFYYRSGIEDKQEVADGRVIPKAHMLYIWLRSKFNMVHGGIEYSKEAVSWARPHGVTLHSEKIVSFDMGRVLQDMNLIPDQELLVELCMRYQTTADDTFKRKLLKAVIEPMLKDMKKGETIDVISLWVLGGYSAIYKVLRTAH